MTSPINAIREKLQKGKIVLLDGATGTELQKRGAPMHNETWCGVATLSHGDLLRQIHEDYIRAGADIITANTFSTNRNMLEPAGFGDRVAEINRLAVKIALEARERAATGRPVVVAGSMSHQIPILPGTAQRNPELKPAPETARRNFIEMAELLAQAGVDMILMEMMSDPDYAVPAIEAAVSTGLPVWVGTSFRRKNDGDIVAYSVPELLFTDALRQIVPAGGEVFGVMHSDIHSTTTALEIMRRHFRGPLMAYPDSGYFTMPDWHFADIIPADEFAAFNQDWIKNHGVQIIGGCCGLGVEHIKYLHNMVHN